MFFFFLLNNRLGSSIKIQKDKHFIHNNGLNEIKRIDSVLEKRNSSIIYDKENVIRHLYYSFVYSEKDEQPFWVKYINTKQSISIKDFKRKNNFREDPLVKTQSASLEDYRNSGFDRGHLCPAGDMSFSEQAMSESFYMSNMSPQNPSFNRGIWKKLENKAREWADIYDSTIIYCGGVLDSIRTSIGPNKVSVPKYYYKVVYCPKIKSSVGFILPNQKCDKNLTEYVVNVDSVEKITHLDFYSNLPLDIQENMEKNYNLSLWF